MPGVRTQNIDTNTLLTTTLGHYRKNITDNAFAQLPFFYWLRKIKGQVRVDGGEPIVIPLEYGTNPTIKFITKRSKLDTTAYDPLMEAKFYWAIIGGTLVIPDFDVEVLNRGSAQLIQLVQPYVRNTEKSFAKVLGTQLVKSRASALEVWGLPDMVRNSNPASGNFGDIDRSTYTWWQAQQFTYDTNLGLLGSVNRLYNMLSDGPDVPDLGLCSMVVYEKYEALLPSHLQYTDVRLAETKFAAIKHGNLTLMMDKSLDAQGDTNTMYMLNSDYIQLVESEEWSPKLGEFTNMPDEPTRMAKLLWAGQLTCSNCSKQGKLVSIA